MGFQSVNDSLGIIRRYASCSQYEFFGFVTYGLKKQLTVKLLGPHIEDMMGL